VADHLLAREKGRAGISQRARIERSSRSESKITTLRARIARETSTTFLIDLRARLGLRSDPPPPSCFGSARFTLAYDASAGLGIHRLPRLQVGRDRVRGGRYGGTELARRRRSAARAEPLKETTGAAAEPVSARRLLHLTHGRRRRLLDTAHHDGSWCGDWEESGCRQRQNLPRYGRP
jgi:hypothetical protein